MNTNARSSQAPTARATVAQGKALGLRAPQKREPCKGAQKQTKTDAPNLYPFQELGFRATPLNLWLDMLRLQDERVKQVAIGGSILLVLTLVVTGMWVTWRMLPGLLGEWIGFMVGIMTTPFCMETSFVIIGLVIVIFLNHWRQQRDGDEFVDLADFPSSKIETKPQNHDDQNPIS